MNWQSRVDMVKKHIEVPEEKIPAPRYAAYFIDQITKVQIGAATDDLDKFTKTDLMKMVKVFKEEVTKENEKSKKSRESRKHSDSKVSKRVRSTRKIPKQ